ncbi:MAG: flagellar type III secretion system pore protein FliP [Planctomycetales bacterium]|nr:flagellar type III secretion system pore protein FliP [Planctomycetales bacterium]
METATTDYIALADQIANSSAVESLSPPIRVALFLGAFALLSTALVSVTAFTRIVIVLSFVRRALTTQEIPPTSVVIGLSFFLTLFVMAPTLDEIVNESITPYVNEEKSMGDALRDGGIPLRKFMVSQTREEDLGLMMTVAKLEAPTSMDVPVRVLIPAFIISELKTAFIMGFCIYIPFLLIDLVVSTVLMSLGMMMMPPVMISLPFKILLFVLVDGWQLVIRAISSSFL